ncbi:FAD dependent oxidoreductase [Schizopora paradoxa]|uniref:FAD dependent oxidoreductase n=1 Tax=Schizopora paradoxa TaxID=27342 RepID=A0A0H2R6K4_9AGAM|nr:FAD dependent oxidoreductase [Schizopora paradoxa]
MSTKHIVIIGGGIIGCTSAYYITHHPTFTSNNAVVTILEASSVAGGASGKAGGLVAKWAYPKELVDVTFAEHERLAREHNGKERWGFRYTGCGQWTGRGEDVVRDAGEMTSKTSLEKKEGLVSGKNTARRNTGLPDDLDWVKEDLTDAYEPMAGDGETAQVHPYQFTTSMCELAQEKGAKLVIGKASAINYSGSGASRSVSGVEYVNEAGSKEVIPASTVIVAAGPWTSTLLPSVPISGTRAHSITVRPTRPVSAYALFTEITLPRSSFRTSLGSPEIYARPNNEVYACSPGDGEPLPSSTKEVKVDQQVCEALFKQISAISSELRGEVTASQACYLPNVNSGPRGCPIVGEVDNAKDLIIAAGHTCWVSLSCTLRHCCGNL